MRLARRPGQKEERYSQLLGDEDELDAPGEPASAPVGGEAPVLNGRQELTSSERVAELERRVAVLWASSRSPSRGGSGRGRGVIDPHLLLASTSDTATGVGIPLALAAGLVSFLSPCVLPLVPGYLSTVIGVTPTDLKEGVGPAACSYRACCS